MYTDPALTPDELAITRATRAHVIARTRAALRLRARAAERPKDAARWARDFLRRLDAAAPWEPLASKPHVAALAVCALHENYLERWAHEPKQRGRGRPKKPTGELEDALLHLLSAVKLPETARGRRVAAIVSRFWGVRVDWRRVLDDARKRGIYTQPRRDKSDRAKKVREGRRAQLKEEKQKRPRV